MGAPTSHAKREVRIEITSRCNLRCTYCAASQPGYQGTEMPPWMVGEIHAHLKGKKIDLVHLSGHGETTSMRNWHEVCRPFVEEFPVGLTSNFARLFSEEENRWLVRFKYISISLDTADADLLREIRRKVSLSMILANLRAIQETAADEGKAGPDFTLLSGIYDRNVFHLGDLARLAVDLGLEHVVFWNYIKYPDLPGVPNVHPIHTMSEDDQRRALEAIDAMSDFLISHGVEVEFAGDFVETFRRRIHGECETASDCLTEEPVDGMTRDCLDPWTYLHVSSDGRVFPCCRHGPIGRMESGESIDSILEGHPIREIREGLLSGRPDPECSICANRPLAGLEEFRERHHREVLSGAG